MKDNEMAMAFIQKAEAVSARVYPVADISQALEKAVEICSSKPPLDPQMDAGQNFDPDNRIMAAPNLDAQAYEMLSKACEAQGGITLIQEGIRNHPWGIDMGVTLMDFGIVETGTLVLDSKSEETRLATMLSEFHVAILKASDIRASALEMDNELKSLTRDEGAYTAFITGASRTADIERVLAMGVHGPLELHIMLVEE